MTRTAPAPDPAAQDRPGPGARGRPALGVAALLTAVGAGLPALVPGLGWIAFGGAAVAAGLAVGGLARAERRPPAVLAIVLAVAVAVGGALNGVGSVRSALLRIDASTPFNAAAGASEPPVMIGKAVLPRGQRYVVEVESDARSVAVGVDLVHDGIGEELQEQESAPFAEAGELRLRGPGRDRVVIAGLAVDPGPADRTTCRITIDGRVVVTRTVRGAVEVVCSAQD